MPVPGHRRTVRPAVLLEQLNELGAPRIEVQRERLATLWPDLERSVGCDGRSGWWTPSHEAVLEQVR